MSHALPARRSLSAISVAVLTIGLAACSPLQPDPLVAEIEGELAPLADMGFEPLGELVESCGAQLGFGCSTPLYELTYSGPVSAPVGDVCSVLVGLLTEIGAPTGYGSAGSDLGPWPESSTTVVEFCVEGLAEPMSDPAFGTFYQGTQMVDGGADDGTAKSVQVQREPTGEFRVLVAISRDLNRVGVIVGASEPAHLTAEQIAANGDFLTQQAATQAFANTLIGMDVEAAETACAAAGYTTYDLRGESPSDTDALRIGLNVVDGVVIDAFAG